MRILFLYQYFGTPNGSWSTRVYEICRLWVESGAHVTVVTSPYDKSDIQVNTFITKSSIDGIDVITIDAGDSNRFGILKRAYRAVLFAVVASYYAIKFRGDLVIASSGPITIGIPGLLGKWFSKKKLVFEVRDLWPGGAIEMGLMRNKLVQKVFLKLENVCYSNSALVVPCSLGMEANILKRFPNTETLVIPNACDVELFQKKSESFQFPEWLEDDDKLLIYTGSLGLMDACDEIIHGFAKVKNKEKLKLVFIGDGSERNVLEGIVRNLELKQYVYFLGLIPKTDVVSWYSRALVSFVVFKNYPILSTSSPNKMFDSFAAGVPIIQNTQGWIYNLVEINSLGINVEPKNENQMCDAIEYLINHTMIQEEMSQNVKKMALNEFNRKKLSIKYLNKLKCLD